MARISRVFGNAFLAIIIERYSRRNRAVFERQTQLSGEPLYTLKGAKALVATGFALVILALAFAIPTAVLVSYAFNYFDQAWNDEFFLYAWQSLKIATMVSILAITLSILVVYYQRLSTARYTLWPGRLASTGYALPGTVLAIAVLLPLTSLEVGINDWLAQYDYQPGLFLSGTIFAIVCGYLVRF